MPNIGDKIILETIKSNLYIYPARRSRGAVREPPLLLIHGNNGKLIHVSFMPGANFIYIFSLRALR